MSNEIVNEADRECAGATACTQAVPPVTPAQQMRLRRENEERAINNLPLLTEPMGGPGKLLAVAARGTPASAAQISLPYQFSNSQGDSFVISTQGYIQSQNNNPVFSQGA